MIFTLLKIKLTVFKMLFRIILVCLCVFQFGCSPVFNWRTTHFLTHGDRYNILFPGVPINAQKTLKIVGQQGVLTVIAVQKDTAQWALGHISAANESLARAIAESLSDSFSSKISSFASRKTLKIPNTLGSFEVNYAPFFIKNKPYVAVARFIWTKNAAYQVLTIGQTEDLPLDIANTFVSSLQFTSP
ncbi:MAG: hypothetical protein RI956_122 [Pseudomonadota bacterium]|jgi:hypothetical protein